MRIDTSQTYRLCDMTSEQHEKISGVIFSSEITQEKSQDIFLRKVSDSIKELFQDNPDAEVHLTETPSKNGIGNNREWKIEIFTDGFRVFCGYVARNIGIYGERYIYTTYPSGEKSNIVKVVHR